VAPRVRDLFIPEDEPLYRSICRDHVAGEDVLPGAVDLPRCSFDRSKYCSGPGAVLTSARPRDTGVVSITPGTLPGPVPRSPGSSGEPYEFIATDDPNPPEAPDNDAHAEVRLTPKGQPFSKNHKVRDKAVLAKAKDELCRKLKLIIRPL
jgi:hypothetical protein